MFVIFCDHLCPFTINCIQPCCCWDGDIPGKSSKLQIYINSVSIKLQLHTNAMYHMTTIICNTSLFYLFWDSETTSLYKLSCISLPDTVLWWQSYYVGAGRNTIIYWYYNIGKYCYRLHKAGILLLCIRPVPIYPWLLACLPQTPDYF